MKPFIIFCLFFVLIVSSCEKAALPSSAAKLINDNNHELSESAIAKMINFYAKEISGNKKTRANTSITLVKTEKKYYSVRLNLSTTRGVVDDDSIAVYNCAINNGTDEGYAIVIGDDRIPCVLSYVPYGNLNDTLYNEGFREWFNTLPESIRSIYERYKSNLHDYNNHADLKTRTPIKDPPLESPYPIAKDSIFLGNTWIDWWYGVYLNDAWFTCRLCSYYKANILSTQWNQASPYNNFMREISCSGENIKAYTGCTTTALAQILAHYEYPLGYNWTLLKQTPRIYSYSDLGQVNEVARLMNNLQNMLQPIKFDCEGTTISRSNLLSTLNNYFTYDTQSSNFDYYKNSLPVLHCALSPSGVGHCYVIDGYAYTSYAYVGYPQNYRFLFLNEETGTYYYEYWDPLPEDKVSRLDWELINGKTAAWHINWGWGGRSDGWFVQSDGGGVYSVDKLYIYNFRKKY